MGYEYYDTPDGQDIFPKLWYTGKNATGAAISVGIVDCILLSKTKGIIPTVSRLGFYVVPFVGMAAAFTSTVYISTNLRKKDDYINYIFGGISAGGVFGAWVKKPGYGLLACFSFAIAGAIKKYAEVNNYPLIPLPDPAHGTVRSHKYDFTLFPERPGNWVKE